LSSAINDPLTERIIGLAIEIHRALGPGLLESVYEECLCYELREAGIEFERQLALPVIYKSVALKGGYRLDVVAEQKVILEIKAIECLLPVHQAQVLTYLKLSKFTTGLLMNFNSAVLKDGLRRLYRGMTLRRRREKNLTASPSPVKNFEIWRYAPGMPSDCATF